MGRNRKDERGYTLLELLAAFSLVLLLATLVFDGLKFGNRVWATSSDGFKDQQDLLTARTLIRDWVENAHPVEASSRDHLRFTGARGRLEFVAPLNPGAAFTPFYEITLEFRPLENDLLVRWRDLEKRSEGERILLRGVETIIFSYFSEPLEEEDGWVSNWQGRDRLPALVRVSLKMEGESGRIDLIAPTKIGWGADCLFDITTRSCRGAGA